MRYEDFANELNRRIKRGYDLYYELLIKVIENPDRYTGFFRVNDVRTKLIQNVAQSREIKFGDFLEDVITWYISAVGYKNLDKQISDELKADQLFLMDDKFCLIEQKLRDDHDSTKKRGQYDNFRRKYTALKGKYPGHEVIAVMWFIDERFTSNINYYIECAKRETIPSVHICVMYGAELFLYIFEMPNIWEELCSHLLRYRSEFGNETLTIPDFDTSPEILTALRRLKAENARLYSKLLSSRPEYIRLRAELFPSGFNLLRV